MNWDEIETRLEDLYRELADRLLRTSYDDKWNEQFRKDAIHDAIVDAFIELRPGIESERLNFLSYHKVLAYLFKAARNRYMDRLRKRAKQLDASMSSLTDMGMNTPGDSTEDEKVDDIVAHVLDENVRELLSLRYSHCLGMQDIADRLGCSVSQVHRRINSALNELRLRIEED